MYEGKPTLVETGDFVNMPPGITHYLYDYSPDMCFLEIAMAGTPDGMIPEEAVEPFCDTRRQRPGRGLILQHALSEVDGEQDPSLTTRGAPPRLEAAESNDRLWQSGGPCASQWAASAFSL
jgi:hypothetical protein